MIRKASLLLAATVLFAGTASAQATARPRSSTSGFFIGLGVSGSSIKFDGDTETESGSGATLQLGYGFTPKFAMFVEGTGASMSSDDPYNLGHFDIGARYSFASPSRAFVPFLEAALSGRAAVQENVSFDNGATSDDLSLSGAGFSFGGGLAYFFNPKWALNTGLKWTVGEFNTVKYGDVTMTGFEGDATTARFNLGMTWYPKGR